MKKGKGLPPAHNEHPNVTPLIDVVMCLIIFYMLVAKIGIATGNEQKIDLPTTSIGTKLNDPGNAVTLNVMRPTVENVEEAFKDPVLWPAALKRRMLEEEMIVTAWDPSINRLVWLGSARHNVKRKDTGAIMAMSDIAKFLRRAKGEMHTEGNMEVWYKPAAGKENLKLKVVIRGDGKQLKYQHIMPVLAACAEAGVKSVNFAAQAEGAKQE